MFLCREIFNFAGVKIKDFDSVWGCKNYIFAVRKIKDFSTTSKSELEKMHSIFYACGNVVSSAAKLKILLA
jgi:hypothetical protein